jgi:hypothetical protein
MVAGSGLQVCKVGEWLSRPEERLAKRLAKVCQDRRMEQEFQCCICGQGGALDDMFGVSLFPARNPDLFQEWFAHPRCIRGIMVAEARDAPKRDEIQAMWERD